MYEIIDITPADINAYDTSFFLYLYRTMPIKIIAIPSNAEVQRFRFNKSTLFPTNIVLH